MKSKWLRRFAVKCAVAVVVVAALAVSLSLRPSPGLRLLCSNNEESCRSVADAYSKESGVSVAVTRMPTSQALARIESAPGEFDAWLGGPAEAYMLAEHRGLLEASRPDLSNIPSRLVDPRGYWHGVYAGVLVFCVRDESLTSWADLASLEWRGRYVLPDPLTSGTAASMLQVLAEVSGENRAKLVEFLKNLDAGALTYTMSGTSVAHLVAVGAADATVTFAPYCKFEKDQGAPVNVVYPLEGTGYEIGAVAVLTGAEPIAHDFVSFAVSDSGQRAGIVGSGQQATSLRIENNIETALAALNVEIVQPASAVSGAKREKMTEIWVDEVRRGSV